MTDPKELRVNSVGVEAGSVNLWMLPLWLKGDKVVRAVLTPREARKLAIKLLEAAESGSPD